MKKAVVLAVCIVCLVASLILCFTGESENKQAEIPDVVGTWALASVDLGGGNTMDADFPDEYDYWFELTEDGSATVHARGVTYTTSYTIHDEWLTFSGEHPASTKLEISGDTIKMKMSITGAGLVFIRK